MSWIQDTASFAKKIILLSEQVEKNSQEIESLRQDLNQLQNDASRLAYAIERNRDKIGDFREQAQNRDEAIYWKLKAELANFENRMNSLNQNRSLSEGNKDSPEPPEA